MNTITQESEQKLMKEELIKKSEISISVHSYHLLSTHSFQQF